jgi:hypothetical protein
MIVEFTQYSKAKKRLFVLLLIFAFGAIPVVTGAEVVEGEGIENRNFSYNPSGFRDPFKPLIKKQTVKGFVKEKRNLGPLEKYELGQFQLMAMLIVSGEPRAMIKSPDGKSYVVKVGDRIGLNDGVIKRIETKVVSVDEQTFQRVEKSPDRIVIEESGTDEFTDKIVVRERYIEM